MTIFLAKSEELKLNGILFTDFKHRVWKASKSGPHLMLLDLQFNSKTAHKQRVPLQFFRTLQLVAIFRPYFHMGQENY